MANCYFDSLFSYRFLLIYATFFFLFSSLLLVHVSLLSFIYSTPLFPLFSFLSLFSFFSFPFSKSSQINLISILFYSNIEKFSGNLVIVNEILVNSNPVFRDNFLPFWDYKGIFAWIDQSLSHPKAHFEFVRWPYLRISMLQDCTG